MLAVGPGKKNDDGKVTAVDVKVGDKVLFGKYSGTTVKVDGDELLVMREEDIMAVVELTAAHAHEFERKPTWQPKTSNSTKTRALA